MSSFQKAMVLLDMARDHLQDAARSPAWRGDAADIRDMIEDVDRVVGVLESFDNWPQW